MGWVVRESHPLHELEDEGEGMSSRNERGEATCVGMSARILTPDSPVPDLLEQFGDE